MIKPKETFHFNLPLEVKEDWIIALISRRVYNSIFNINPLIHKLEIYTDTFDEFSFEELKDELEEILKISDNTPYDLQHERLGPRIIKAYKELRSDTY